MRKQAEGGLQSLARGLDVLRILAERACTVEELGRALGIPRSTAYRTLTALRDRQLVERDPRHARYTLGYGILRLARALLGRVPVRDIALPTMRELVASVEETAVLTVRDGRFGVAVESIEASGPVRVAPAPGERVPLHVGAPMKALLAFLPPEEIEAYLKRPLEKPTARAIADPRKLRAHLAQIRQRGYAESWEEVYPGAVGVAVPIVGPDGVPVASLAIAGPVHRFTPDRVLKVAHELLPAGKELTRRIQSLQEEKIR
jgi:DNA-binding IclR family transcriptional regulator